MLFLTEGDTLPKIQALASIDWHGIYKTNYAGVSIYEGCELHAFIPHLTIYADNEWIIFADDLYEEGENRSAVVGLVVREYKDDDVSPTLFLEEKFSPFLEAKNRKIYLLITNDYPYPPLPHNPAVRVLRGILLETPSNRAAIYSATGFQTTLTFDSRRIERLLDDCTQVPLP